MKKLMIKILPSAFYFLFLGHNIVKDNITDAAKIYKPHLKGMLKTTLKK